MVDHERKITRKSSVNESFADIDDAVCTRSSVFTNGMPFFFFQSSLVITKRQQDILQQIKEFSLNRRGHEVPALHFPSHLKAGDRHFIETVATDLGLHYAVEYEGDGDTRHVYIDFPENEEGEEEETEDEEDLDARQRVLAKYEAAEVIEDVVTEEQRDLQESQRKEEIMHDWKVNYYGVSVCFLFD
jgi:5'-3' exoribonuclease 1